VHDSYDDDDDDDDEDDDDDVWKMMINPLYSTLLETIYWSQITSSIIIFRDRKSVLKKVHYMISKTGS